MDDFENEINDFSKEIDRIVTEVENKYKREYSGYNILDYLTKHHLEEFHTNLISDFLNPKGKHGNGGKFLKAFMEVIQQKERDKSAGFCNLLILLKNFTDKDYNEAIVEKEYRIPDLADPLIYGRLDVFIRFRGKKINVVLENKIYSNEGDNQLGRYDSYCKTLEEKFSILYLTLHGDAPMSSKGVDYVSISYDKQIEKWLEECSKVANGSSSLKEGITTYKNMLHTKFFDSKHERIMEKITEFIITQENKELLKHQVAIQDAIIPVRNYYRDQFFKEVIDKLREKHEVEIMTEELKTIDVKDLWNKKHNEILIRDKNLTYRFNDESKTMYFLIEHDCYELYYGFVVIIEKNGTRVYEKGFFENENVKMVEKAIKDHFSTETLVSSQEMFAQRIFYPLGLTNKLSFPDDRLNYEFAVNMQEIVKKFISNIETYLKVFKNSIERLKSYERQIYK